MCDQRLVKQFRFLTISAIFIATLCSASSVFAQADAKKKPKFPAADVEFFQKKVRPLLEVRCFKCHGTKTKAVKGELLLDSRAGVLKGGETGPAAVPGKPEKSLLIKAIQYEDLEMPPRTKLPKGEIAILTKWVKLGLPWSKETPGKITNIKKEPFPLEARKRSHWAWKSVCRPVLPNVRNPRWAETEIDRFILAKLESRQLSPAPPASRRTLIRRAYFDLAGLPPSRKEVTEFLNDPAPTPAAFAKVVDRLLKSPHFGERWARHWLDLVRYAETLGHEFDYPLHHAFQYRDYVIRAINADVPYRQFVTEHIAGDLLQKPRMHPDLGYNESVIGTGFWFLGEDKHAPVDVKGEESSKIDNQIDVFSRTFLGLTVACARCHDHKFDAITSKDYYALAGFLQSSRRHEALLDPHGTIQKQTVELAKLRNQGGRVLRTSLSKSIKTLRQDTTNYLQAARTVIIGNAKDQAGEVKRAAVKFRVDPTRLGKFVAALKSNELNNNVHPLWVWKQLAITKPEQFARRRNDLKKSLSESLANHKRSLARTKQFAEFSGEKFSDWFVTGFAFGKQVTQPGQWNSAGNGPSFSLPGRADSGLLANKLAGVLRSPTFPLTHDQIMYRIKGNGRIRLVIDGYVMVDFSGLLFSGCSMNVNTKGKWQWIRQAGDIHRYKGRRAHIEIIDNGNGSISLDEVRFANRADPNLSEKPFTLAGKLLNDEKPTSPKLVADKLTNLLAEAIQTEKVISVDQTHLLNFALQSGLLQLPAAKELVSVTAEIRKTTASIPAPMRVIAMTDGSPEDEFVFIRGNHKTPGPAVHRRLLQAISSAKQPRIQSGSGRLELAKRMFDPANPFPSRVMVNRVWHQLFGRGIVGSVDNFGILGQHPTHPELLDHLADTFAKDGWSVKRLIRRVMLSNTYRMASKVDANALQIDPQNLLLHRMPIRRLQGEAIRDAMLTVSGRLDRKLHGPSVPVYLTRFMQGRGRPRRSGPLDGNGRRSLYTSVRRNFLSPMMRAFDMPTPFTTIGRRNVSNVPAQALILMNDPFVSQQASLWAKNLLADSALSPESRINNMYQTAFARPATTAETKQAIAFLKIQSQTLKLKPDAWKTHLQAWGDLCHVMFNLKEFVFLR